MTKLAGNCQKQKDRTENLKKLNFVQVDRSLATLRKTTKPDISPIVTYYTNKLRQIETV